MDRKSTVQQIIGAKELLYEIKVSDHEHYNGKYRRAAHYKCNINLDFKDYNIPVFIHNLKGYDEHLIIDAFGKYGKYIEQKTVTLEDEDGTP